MYSWMFVEMKIMKIFLGRLIQLCTNTILLVVLFLLHGAFDRKISKERLSLLLLPDEI
jgi:hypothetical protein